MNFTFFKGICQLSIAFSIRVKMADHGSDWGCHPWVLPYKLDDGRKIIFRCGMGKRDMPTISCGDITKNAPWLMGVELRRYMVMCSLDFGYIAITHNALPRLTDVFIVDSNLNRICTLIQKFPKEPMEGSEFSGQDLSKVKSIIKGPGILVVQYYDVHELFPPFDLFKQTTTDQDAFAVLDLKTMKHVTTVVNCSPDGLKRFSDCIGVVVYDKILYAIMYYSFQRESFVYLFSITDGTIDKRHRIDGKKWYDIPEEERIADPAACAIEVFGLDGTSRSKSGNEEESTPVVGGGTK